MLTAPAAGWSLVGGCSPLRKARSIGDAEGRHHSDHHHNPHRKQKETVISPHSWSSA